MWSCCGIVVVVVVVVVVAKGGLEVMKAESHMSHTICDNFLEGLHHKESRQGTAGYHGIVTVDVGENQNVHDALQDGPIEGGEYVEHGWRNQRDVEAYCVKWKTHQMRNHHHQKDV